MTALVSVVLLMIGAEDASAARFAHAAEVFTCNFDASWDKDFVGWPDGWTRQRGPGFPFYIKMKIAQDAPPAGGRCLEVLLDGGAAAAISPPRPIDPAFDYVAEAWVKTSNLKHDHAFLALVLTDERHHEVERFSSDKITRAPEWRKIRIGPVRITSPEARLVSVELHVEPTASRDLNGSVRFGDVWLGRIPQTRLETSDRRNFFTDPSKVELRVSVSGEFQQSPTVAMKLEDVLGHCVDEIEEMPKMTAHGSAVAGSLRWSPRVEDSGFYRVVASVRQGDALCDRRELSLVVLKPAAANAGSEFGMSLPQGIRPLGYDDLARFTANSGIGWLKLPLWLDPEADEETTQRMIAFCQQIRDQGIEPVGLLSPPPPLVLKKLLATRVSAAELFTRDTETWYPALEPTLVRLAAQVGYWQLGGDDDFSLVDHPKLEETVAKVKKAIDRIGQDTRIGVSWMPGNPPEPLVARPPWRFLSFFVRNSDDRQQIAETSRRSPASPVQRWVVIEPANRSAMAAAPRATDLVKRMAAAKVGGADVIFCTNPFDDETGLMRADGTPGELFLPWRTAAQCLGGAEYLGSAVLAHGSKNYVFLREKDAVMLLWSSATTTEPLSLGGGAQQIDLWGRTSQPVRLGNCQAVTVEPTPGFVVGISKPLAQWMLSLDLEKHEAATSFGALQENAICVKNPFAETIKGRIALAMPDGWQAVPSTFDFEAAPGEQLALPFRLILPFNAQTGPQNLRLDSSLQGDEEYALSVYRQITVGCPDLAVRVASDMDSSGELVVTQRLSNTGPTASFRCDLYLPGRTRLAATVTNLGPNEDRKVYRVPDGAGLLGKTLWLHIEEIDGPRILNHRFIAEE